MQELEAKMIHNLISKENRLKAVEISGFVAALKNENKCNDTLLEDVENYVGMISILFEMFKNDSPERIGLHENPIDGNDFAKLVKFHVEINELFKIAQEQS